MRAAMGISKALAVLVACAMLSACAWLRTPEGFEYATLGIADVEVCHKYEGREDKLVERCDKVKTDGFSGWKAIMNGAAEAVVKMLTLGLL